MQEVVLNELFKAAAGREFDPAVEAVEAVHAMIYN